MKIGNPADKRNVAASEKASAPAKAEQSKTLTAPATTPDAKPAAQSPTQPAAATAAETKPAASKDKTS